MSARRITVKGLLITVGISALVVIPFASWRYFQLRWASTRIEQLYSREISSLSEYLIARPDWRVRDENPQKELEAIERLSAVFVDEAITHVTISIDGHHGLTSVKHSKNRDADEVLTRGVVWAAGAEPKDKVYMGWSSNGERFYVYEGLVPEAQHVRWFQLWIHRSSLESED